MSQTQSSKPRKGHEEKSRGPNGAAIKYYLVAYNVLSAIGWGYILVCTVMHLAGYPASLYATAGSPLVPKTSASVAIGKVMASVPYLNKFVSTRTKIEASLPKALLPIFRRATTTHALIGPVTAQIQSMAILDVIHAALGLVRSPVGTVTAQVASRLITVWGVVEQFEVAKTNPIFASMVLAWSLTEVIRYSSYATNLLGVQLYPLLWLRYSLFWVLYPVGASSEAFVNYSTFPSSSPLSFTWSFMDYVRLGMFIIWWPSLYVLMSYMASQRRKALGKGSAARKLGNKPKTL